jgi:hypothetical protein
MPGTTPRGYTYATADDPNDLALISQRLAEQIDNDVQDVEDATRPAIYATGKTSTTGYTAGTWANPLNLELPADSPPGTYALDLNVGYAGNGQTGLINIEVHDGNAQANPVLPFAALALNAQTSITQSAGIATSFVHPGGQRVLSVWVRGAGAIAIGSSSVRASRA